MQRLKTTQVYCPMFSVGQESGQSLAGCSVCSWSPRSSCKVSTGIHSFICRGSTWEESTSSLSKVAGRTHFLRPMSEGLSLLLAFGWNPPSDVRVTILETSCSSLARRLCQHSHLIKPARGVSQRSCRLPVYMGASSQEWHLTIFTIFRWLKENKKSHPHSVEVHDTS